MLVAILIHRSQRMVDFEHGHEGCDRDEHQ
jgi:hypothetical protein